MGTDSLLIGIGSGLASMLLPRMFPRDAFPPNLHLEIKTAPTRVIFDELHDDRLDLGIVAEVAPDRIPSGLASTFLFELEMELIMSPQHPLTARKGTIDIGLLTDEPIIINELSIGYGQIVNQMFNDIGVRPSVRAVVDNVETIKVMVRTGAGIALIPAGGAELEQKLGLLQSRRITPVRPVRICAYRLRHGLPRRKESILEKILAPALGPRD